MTWHRSRSVDSQYPHVLSAPSLPERSRNAVYRDAKAGLTDPAASIGARHGLRVDGRYASFEARVALTAGLAELEARVRGGESLQLLCHCHPKRCHCHSIAKVIYRRLGRKEGPATIPRRATWATDVVTVHRDRVRTDEFKARRKERLRSLKRAAREAAGANREAVEDESSADGDDVVIGGDDMMSGGSVQSEDGGGGGTDGTATMAEDEGGAEGDDDMMVGDDDMMSDGDVQSKSGDDGNAEGAAAMGVMDDNEVVGHDMVTGAADVDGGGMRGGAKRSRGTDDEAEGHEEEDGEEGGYREAGDSVHSTAGGGMTNDSAVRVGARGEQMEVNSTATAISARKKGGGKKMKKGDQRRREKHARMHVGATG